MTGYNMPPGVSPWDIPGNRPEDVREALEQEAETEDTTQTNQTVAQLAQELLLLRDAISTVEDELSELKKRRKELEETSIPDAMRAAGMVSSTGKGSCTLSTGETIYLINDVSVSVRGDKREEQFAWLRERGDDDIIKPTVNAQTFKAYIKEIREKGESLPDFINTYDFIRIGVRKPKGGK